LQEVGLGYLVIAQNSSTLSGGEAQRVKLAKVLSQKVGDRCVYLLDTPSRGLHTADLPVLVAIFQKIIDKCNTVVIAESREEILNNSDLVIKL
jgi:excinuclease ABC subunit A